MVEVVLTMVGGATHRLALRDVYGEESARSKLAALIDGRGGESPILPAYGDQYVNVRQVVSFQVFP